MPLRRMCCRLPTCSSSRDKNPELKFFSFPGTRHKQLQWLEAVGIPAWRSLPPKKLRRHHHLCSLHFEDGCISPFNHLFLSAVPTLHLFPDPKDAKYISEEDHYLIALEQSKYMKKENAPRCSNCSHLMVTRGKLAPEQTSSVWRRESNGIRIVENIPSVVPDPKTGVKPQQPKVLLMSIPEVLNSILKLPKSNLITKEVRLCSECSSVLAKMVALLNLLRTMSNPKSMLNKAVFHDLELIHSRILFGRDEQELKMLKEGRGNTFLGRKFFNEHSSADSKRPTRPPPPPPRPQRPTARTSRLIVKPWPSTTPVPKSEAPVPIIIKTQSLTVTPGFIQPREDVVVQKVVISKESYQVEEPMEENDPLDDTPTTVPDHHVPIKLLKIKVRKQKNAQDKIMAKQRHFRVLAEKLQKERQAKKKPTTPGVKRSAEEARRRRYENRRTYTHPPCPHCGLVFKQKYNKYALDQHIRVRHTFNSKFTCDICARPFPTSTTVRQHRMTHMNEEERSKSGLESFLCPECGRMFKSDKSLQNHLETHADLETRLLRCPEENCDYSTLCAMTLKRHARLHDPTAETPFKCTKCGEAFKIKKLLHYHVMKDCAAPDRVHACDVPGCGKRFKWKQGLVLHYLSRFHRLRAEEAREKVYPGLPCPDWVDAQISKNAKR